MKALVLNKINQVKLQDVEMPKIKSSTDVIIKVTTTTICGSDIHLIHGHIPSTPGYILGHEYVGVIDQVGEDVQNFRKGDRVIGTPVPFCGECFMCKQGHIEHCFNGGHPNIFGSGIEAGDHNGSHCEYMRIPNADMCLIKVPDCLEDEDVIFLSDIASTGYTPYVNTKLNKNSTVVVFGAGAVGLSSVATAKLNPNINNIILVGRQNEFRINIGKKLGADRIINASHENVIEEIRKETKGLGANLVIDASGSPVAISQAFNSVRPHGTVFFLGITNENIELPYYSVFMNNVNINMGLANLSQVKTLLDSVLTKKLDLKPLITHRRRLEDIESAINIFENRKENVIKIVIKP